MDVAALQAFLEVAESESFTEAASALHLTQPAVSKRIANLEATLGCPLFDRIGRRVSLTRAGKALEPHARRVLQELSLATRSVHAERDDIGGELRVATSHHLGLHRLPRLLRQYSVAFPQVSLQLTFMDSEKAYEAVARGDVELAVVTLAPQPVSAVVSYPLWDDPLSVMVASDHRLLRLSSLDCRVLAADRAVLPGLDTYTGRLVKTQFDQRGLELQVAMSTNYLETVRMLASVGFGWTVLPDTMQGPDLLPLSVPELSLKRSLGYIHHNQRSLSRAAQAFLQTLQSSVDTE